MGKFDLTSVTFFMHSALQTGNKELSEPQSRHHFPVFLEELASALPQTQKSAAFVLLFSFWKTKQTLCEIKACSVSAVEWEESFCTTFLFLSAFGIRLLTNVAN